MRVERKNDVSLRLLEIFGSMMRCQTTVEAAEELGISQPAVSAGIKQLESQLGITLFTRVKRRLQPTEEAREIFIEIEPVFTLLRSFGSRVRDMKSGKAGRLRIMATPPLGHTVVPGTLKRFLSRRKEVSVLYDVRRLENVVEAVEFGIVDVGLVLALDSHPAVEVRPIHRGDMVCLVPQGHEFGTEPVITPRMLARRGFVGLELASRIGQHLHRAFERSATPYEPQVEVRYCHTAAVLANAGIGVAVVDQFTARFLADDSLLRKPFEPAVSISASILTRSIFPPSRIAAEFIEELQASFAAAVNETPTRAIRN